MKLPRFGWPRRGQSVEPSVRPIDFGTDAPPDADPADLVRWVAPDENPFGIDVLDCSAFARSMVAMTSSADVARRFSELRGSQGEHCRTDDSAGTIVSCRLEYPLDAHAEGPVFLAQQMEDKWDVFLVGGELCFSRSWTGQVAYRAAVSFDRPRAIVTDIRSMSDREAPDAALGVVDYLIKSHVYGLVAPHPLAGAPAGPDKDLAYWSFARYGRRGVFGARADVTHLRVRRDADGRCTLMRPG
jgi:hypothetical protein